MKSVFRKVALERLSSPEQLDLLMQVTSTRSWLAFLALSAVLAAAAYWGVAGRIPVEVEAPAVLIRSGGIRNLLSTTAGQIRALHVAPGDVVGAEQVIADIMPLAGGDPIPVYSMHEGRVLGLKSGVGEIVTPGDALANLEAVGPEAALEAVLYLAPAEGQQVRAGMPVTIVPHVALPDGRALLSGAVTSVGELPVSRQRAVQLLGSEELADAILGAPTPLEVHVRIDDAAGAPEGLSGALASAVILIGEQRPLDLVVPLP